MDIEKILSLYIDVEALNAPSAPKLKPYAKYSWVKKVEDSENALPEGLEKNLVCFDSEASSVPYYHVYFGCIDAYLMAEHIVTKGLRRSWDPIDDVNFRRGNFKYLASASLDWKGRLIEGSVNVAPFLESFLELVKKMGFDNFGKSAPKNEEIESWLLGDEIINALEYEDAVEKARNILDKEIENHNDLLTDEEKNIQILSRERLDSKTLNVSSTPLKTNHVNLLSKRLVETIGYKDHFCSCIEILEKRWFPMRAVPVAPHLSSIGNFSYKDELSRVKEQIRLHGPSAPLFDFLTQLSGSDDRIDLLKKKDVPESLSNEAIYHIPSSPGRWPSNPKYSLSKDQQLAVNLALNLKRIPILSVNGPPGTGKTTMLRDIVAGRVVERAKRLLKVKDPLDAFTTVDVEVLPSDEDSLTFKSSTEKLIVPVIRNEIISGTGIVATANSNDAVENISCEMPMLDAVDLSIVKDKEYLAPVAVNAIKGIGKKNLNAWGLVSLAMGNSKKAKTAAASLVAEITIEDDCNDSVYIQDEDHILEPKKVGGLKGFLDEISSAPTWNVAQKNFSSALNIAELAILEHKRTNKTGPLSNDAERKRSECFLSALALQESFLKSQAIKMGEFAEAFVLLQNGYLKLNEDDELAIWQTIFMIAPLISTTYLSIRRFPAHKEWIGDLLIDEAGQASPHQVVAGMQRARNVVVVGDPMQLEPIRTVPGPIVKALRDLHDIPEYLSPVEGVSVQTIADGTMMLGAYIPDSRTKKEIWSGIPLRIHRRCGNPMFELANRISYGGQMKSANDPKARAESWSGPRSCWFDIQGGKAIGSKRNANTNEINCLIYNITDMFKEPVHKNGEILKISVKIISPFVDCSSKVRRDLKEASIPDWVNWNTGTVHSFQGQEGDVVFLVLGSKRGDSGRRSREWAGSSSNLLNVAITRARYRLYVIGDFYDWKSINYFDKLASGFEKAKAIKHDWKIPEQIRNEKQSSVGF